MKIIRSKDCGNSPKQKFAEDFTIAVLEKDRSYLVEHSTENVSCRFRGKGWKERITDLDTLLETVPDNAKAITIHNVITHGKKASSDASLKTKGSELVELAFFYLFSNAKGTSISEITIYKIEN